MEMSRESGPEKKKAGEAAGKGVEVLGLARTSSRRCDVPAAALSTFFTGRSVRQGDWRYFEEFGI